jgi:hypothetical protein
MILKYFRQNRDGELSEKAARLADDLTLPSKSQMWGLLIIIAFVVAIVLLGLNI